MKKILLACSLFFLLTTVCVNAFALPPSGGGGTECPDRCNNDDVNCCTDPQGKLHCGRLPV